jgi:ribosomal protein S6--L-glutamate ligase
MRIGILSRNQSLYSTRRIVQAARMRGHSVVVVDTLTVPINIGVGRAAVSSHTLPDVEGIVPRIGTSITFYGLAVVRQFETLGVVTTASAQAIARSRDKLHSLQIMSKSGLPIPSTTIVTEHEDIQPAIELAGGLPVIVKLIRGTQGRGVFMATEMRTVEAILRVLQRAKEQMLVQEFVKESSGTDIRIIVVGNRCVAAMKRTAAEGEFRSNLHRGGTAVPFVLDQHTKLLAARAARVHGLGVAGVDLMQSARGPLLLEVNSSPGLQGIERTTKVDVASEVVRYLESEEKRQRRRRQQRSKNNS